MRWNDDGKLAEGWYFLPTSSTAFYMKGTDDEDTTDVDESKSYVPETMYAQFGHWLTVDADHWCRDHQPLRAHRANTNNLEFA